MNEFLPGSRAQKGSREIGGGSYGVLFLNPPHLHTHMLGLNDNRDTQWLECILNAIAYLGSKPLLNLQSTGISIHHACKFAESGDLAIWDIGDMRLTEKWQQMVFAQAVQFDIFYQNHLPVIFVESG